MQKSIVPGAWAVALILALTPSALFAADREIKIGVLYPLSGASADAGAAVLAAVRAAQDVANNVHEANLPLAQTAGLPGLGHAKIRLIVADHRGDREQGRREAERLIREEGVVALYGAYHSSVTEVASAVAERFKIPYVTGESSSPNLHRRGFRWFFRTGPHDGHYTKVMFEFLAALQRLRGIKFSTVGILHEDSTFGTGSARVQDETATAQGLTVVAKMAYPANTNFLVSELETLKTADPDIVLPTSYTNDAMLFINTAKAFNYWPKIIIAQNAGYMDPKFLKSVGTDAEGIISRAPFALDMVNRIPLIRDVNEIYKKHSGGQEIFDPPIRSFVGALVLMDAINRAGSTEAVAIREALKETYIPPSQIPMPWFSIKFGPDGQNTGVGAILVQIQGGQYRTIYPFQFAAREVLYPLPQWSAR